MRIRPEDWVPIGIPSLEPAALDAVRENSSLLVLAGPGAGKTELLAQKACYLLQTQICKPPKRILAISFKKDSAANLKERVAERFDETPVRMDSLTFDSFAKSIFDRFREVLPIHLRPSKTYDIGFPTETELHTFLRDSGYHNRPNNQELHQIVLSAGRNRRRLIDRFVKNHVTGFKLNDPNRNPEHILNWAADLLCRSLIVGNEGKSKISFQMISRLAEHVVNLNPYIKRSIQATYAYVFLDEFQDTTNIQYDFIQSCFLGSPSVLTAVGDNKQTIMNWAGALQNVFQHFQNDFQARTTTLQMNFRCAPRLISLQTVVAQYIDNNAAPQISPRAEGGIIRRIDFRDDGQEAGELAVKVQRLIEDDGIPPEEICFLFKQRIPVNSALMIERLQALNIKARVSDEFQDLLKEDLVKILISFIKYLYGLDQDSRDIVLNVLISETDSVSEIRRAESRMGIFKVRIMNQGAIDFSSREAFQGFVNEVLGFIGMARLSSIILNYSQDHFTFIQNKFIDKFVDVYSRSRAIQEAVNEFLGIGVVSCMSIHKSKGLEFEVVFLIGLEDGMFWSFADQPMDDIQTFFVAISRPKSQLFLTFCGRRGGFSQARNVIRPIYDFLTPPNVEFFDRSRG